MANDWHQAPNRRQQHRRKTDGAGIRDRGSQHGNVHNTNDLDARLCDIWFGNYHIFASIARFPKKDNTQSIPQPDNVRNTSRNATHASQMAAKSYATAVTGDKMAKPVPQKVVHTVMVGGREITDVHSITLAEVREPSSIPNLLNLCIEEGFNNIKIQYVGGLWMWVSYKSSKICKLFMNNAGIQNVFSRFKPLQKDFVIEERLVWLEVIGLPMCAWNPCVFKKVASLWGVVLISDDDETNGMVKEISQWEPDVGDDDNFYEDKSYDYKSEREEDDDNEDEQGNEDEGFTVFVEERPTQERPTQQMVHNENMDIEEGEVNQVVEETVKIPEQTIPQHGDGLHSAPNTAKDGQSSSSKSRPPGFSGNVRSLSNPPGYGVGTPRCTRSAESVGLCKKQPVESTEEEEMQKFISLGQELGFDVEQAKEQLKMMLLRTETRMAKLDLFKVRSLWGKTQFDFACTDSTGNSGDGNDYGPTSSKLFNSWMDMDVFSDIVELGCNTFVRDMSDPNCINFKNKLGRSETRNGLISRLKHIDESLDQGDEPIGLVTECLDTLKQLGEIDKADTLDHMQKLKVKWAIEGDENTKFFHGMLKRRRKQQAIKGVTINGEWVSVTSQKLQ
ncbi:hypothetical protein LXL04_015779 [Taraxacum kok-saghyz]